MILHTLGESAMTAKQVAIQLLEDAGVNVDQLREEVESYLERQPKVKGDENSQKMMGRVLSDVLQASRQLKAELKDSYISTEALLLGLCSNDTLFTANAIASQGVTLDSMKEALQNFRQKSGSGQAGQASRVTSRSAEGLYDSLEKYGIDFTKNAEEGKLDPVIGRDDEIRRAIQVLSRRTKNNPVLIGDPGVGTCFLLWSSICDRLYVNHYSHLLAQCFYTINRKDCHRRGYCSKNGCG
jgi:ATP-dependent Clp protease ATP-binding subunit ClpB